MIDSSPQSAWRLEAVPCVVDERAAVGSDLRQLISKVGFDLVV